MSNNSKKAISIALSITTIIWLSGAFMVWPVSVVKAATIEELLAQIQLLRAQLLTLQGAQAACTFTVSLKVGSRGDDVKCLQQYLNGAGYTVSTSGAGSAGNETTYFGSKTKAAVAAWQAANGVSPAVGYFGPISRSKYSSLVVTTPPPVTPPPTGESLGVSLASDNPAAGTVVTDSTSADGAQALASVLKIQLTAGTKDVKVTSLKLKRDGISSDSDFSNSYLYDGNTRISEGPSVSSGYFTFTNSAGLVTVSAGQTKGITFKVDMANGTTAGKTFKFSVVSNADVAADVTTISGTFPISGNAFSTAQVSDLGTMTITNVSPSAATNIDAGSTDVELWKFSAAASDQKNEISYLKFTSIGTADYDAISNLKLLVDGVQVGSTVSTMASDKTITFDLSGSPISVNSGVTKNISLRGDVIKGSSRTYRFRLSNSADIVTKDIGYGVYLKPNKADVFSIVQSGGDTTINAGSLTISKSTASASGQVALNATNANIAEYDWKAIGESIKVSTVTIQIVDGTNSFTNIKNVKLTVDGSQIGTTVSSLAVDTSQAYSAGNSFIIPAGTTKKLAVYADIASASGAADAMAANDTFTVRLIAGSDNALRQSTGTTFNAPGSNTDANSLTVSSGSITATKNTSVANVTTVQGATTQYIGSWLLAAPAEQGVDVNSVTIRDNTSSTSSEQGAYGLGGAFDALTLKSGGTQYGQVINSPSATSGTTQAFNFSTALSINAGQSIQIDLYANVISTANSTWTDTNAIRVTAVTGTGKVTNSSISLSAGATGQQNTVVTGAALTIANEASPTMPASTYLVAGESGTTLAAWKFTADNTEDVLVTRMQVNENGTDDLPGNAKNIKLFVDGGQKGATVPAITDSTTNTALFEDVTKGLFTVPKNSSKTVYLKLDMTDNTNAGFSTDGSDLRANLSISSGTATASTNVSAKGNTSGQYVTIAAGATSDHQGNNMKVTKSKPTFAVVTPLSLTLVPGTVEVLRFTITASSYADVKFDGTNHNIRFTMSGSPIAATAYNFDLYDDSLGTTVATQIATATASGGVIDFTTVNTTIPAGTSNSKTYYVKAALNNFSAIGSSFQLSINNAAADLSWNDDSSTSADLTNANFTGYGLPLVGPILSK